MTTLLRIESSSNPKGFARQVGDAFLDAIKTAKPGLNVVTRDLAKQPLPHISAEFFSVMYSGDNSAPALQLSETLIAELLAADILMIEAPMYNFGIPSGLKAWIDHVVRAGRTFQYGPNGPEGLAKGKKAYIITSSGGVYSEGPYKAMEHAEAYLRGVLGFIGFTEIETIRTEGIAMGADKAAAALEAAKARAQTLSRAA